MLRAFTCVGFSVAVRVVVHWFIVLRVVSFVVLRVVLGCVELCCGVLCVV